MKLVSDKNITYTIRKKKEEYRKKIDNIYQIPRRNFILAIHFYKINKVPLVNIIESLIQKLNLEQKDLTVVDYKNSSDIRKDDPIIIKLMEYLKLPREEIDRFFTYASNQDWKNNQ